MLPEYDNIAQGAFRCSLYVAPSREANLLHPRSILLPSERRIPARKAKVIMPFDISNWMGRVDDSKKLSELSIPGTHDSASRYIDSNRLTTQTDGILEQLNAGIRFLDIRVGYTNNKFLLYHEDVFLNLGFAEVRDTCRDFLLAHPKESIILSLKKEDDAPSGGNEKGVTFQGRFQKFVDVHPKLFYLENAIPTLKQAQGKIVLFRRFALDKGATAPLGINAYDGFPDNATKTIEGPPKLRIQDEFGIKNTSKADKYKAIEKILKEAVAPGHRDVLYVNFSSAAGVIPRDFPLLAAAFINPRLIEYFKANTRGRFGIVAMDFQTTELNTLIVQTNGIS
jgi:1-phosphatidylinositol phosphodiesterase